jgi:ABC-2 type transport system ATP-binding protein
MTVRPESGNSQTEKAIFTLQNLTTLDILTANNIHKAYSGHTALTDVNLAIPRKSIFGLLGPNGAGKTTFIRIINQIIDADAGQVLINGEPLAPKHVQQIGYLPEERGLYKKMAVGEQLVYFGQLRGLTKRQANERGKAWCKKLEIDAWWNKKVEDLSKGMAQKIQFIATIMHEPELIILDEPFSGFDPVNANLITSEILELREKGSTIIFSTHRMESVEQLCDHVAMIHKSKKILDGTKEAVKAAHKDGTYLVEYRGEIRSNGKFNLLSTENAREDLQKSIVQVAVETNPNELLKELISQVEIHSFIERIPSMNDIFISLVKGTHHE